jgi:small-conductance mechanosensitive channel
VRHAATLASLNPAGAFVRDPRHRWLLSSCVRGTIRNYGRWWLAGFTRVAETRPRLIFIPMEVVGLILLLCLLFFEIGERLGSGSPIRLQNFALLGALFFNLIAFQFRWSQATTVVLRIGAFVGLIATVLLLRY